MASSLNKVMIIGNLGKDPEIRVAGQTKVANFNIATNEGYTGKDGQKVDKVEWHRIVAWGKLADIIEKYVKKGMTVYIEGKLETRSWDDKEGKKHYTTEIKAESLLMLSRNGLTESKPEQSNNYSKNDLDDGLPF